MIIESLPNVERPVNSHYRQSLQPRSRGFPEGLLDQPFYGWGTPTKETDQRASACLSHNALALIIVGSLFQPPNRRTLLMMIFLIADVSYHPFQILRAETNDTVARLPIQNFAIYEFVIHIVRTGAFELSDPISNQQGRRNSNGNMNVRLRAAYFMKD